MKFGIPVEKVNVALCSLIYKKPLEMSVDLQSLKTFDEVQAAFQQLTKEEEDVDKDLEKLLADQVHLETNLRSLTSSLPQLRSTHGEAEKLTRVISFTAELAEGISVKVKQLDLAKSRVSECQQRVHDLIDLKVCSEGVKTALRDEDYEQAAVHLHRFLDMDEELLKVTALEMREDGTASLEAALSTLHEAKAKLEEVISKKFDEAVKDEDLASIERFFKIFPLINLHSEGLKKFASYLQTKLVLAAKKNLKQAVETPSTDVRANVIFADTLTLLFEGIARTIEIHQPLIETYYGPGRLLTVLTMLQGDCDQQAEKIVQEFRKKRSLKEKVMKVKEHHHGTTSLAAASKVSPKEIDYTLSEMALMQARSEMYYKFLRKRVTADLNVLEEEEASRNEKLSQMEKVITRSGLCHCMQDLLADYILLEDYFMSQNIKVAMENNAAAPTLDVGQVTSAMLDDVFFLLKKCTQRSISSHNIDGICAVINNASRILEQDFCGTLLSHLKMGFPSGYLDLTHAYNMIHSSVQQGKLQGGDMEKQKLLFLTALNDTDSAFLCINRLNDAIRRDLSGITSSRSEHEKQKLDNCLAQLPAITEKLTNVRDQGMQQLRQSSIKPRLKPWIDAFMSHDINDDEYAEYEANDPFVQSLILNLDNLLGSFKNSLTENNYDAMVAILATEVTLQLERVIMKSKFSRLGGLLLDREVRSLVSFLTSVTTWSIRDKFTRVSQIATLLNLESLSELGDIWGSGNASFDWKLSSLEVRQVLGLRSDFSADEVKRLRL